MPLNSCFVLGSSQLISSLSKYLYSKYQSVMIRSYTRSFWVKVVAWRVGSDQDIEEIGTHTARVDAAGNETNQCLNVGVCPKNELTTSCGPIASVVYITLCDQCCSVPEHGDYP
jgi:hypothetical protein